MRLKSWLRTVPTLVIIGSVLFGVFSDVLRTLPFVNSREAASLVRIGYGIVLMIIILRMPTGIVGLFRRRA